MWNAKTRPRYNRSQLRYPSDVTDEEWSYVEPIIPPAKHGGRKRSVDLREIVNGIMYVLSTGCQWAYLPKDLPPSSTVYYYFDLWNYDGTLERLHHELYVRCREKLGREVSPTACIIDSQSVKSAEKGGRALIHPATTRVRRLKEKSGTSWSTR
jgi:transposase